MNRRRQIAKRAQGDGQARVLQNLQITTRHLDSDYQMVTRDLVRGETGLLLVLSLVPKTTGKPSFNARVDDGSPGNRRQPELDIDIDGVSPAIKKDFKSNRNGYIGHHTNRSRNPDQRIYKVEIATPAGKVFEGEVSFNATFIRGITAPVTTVASVEATVIRATPNAPARRFPPALDFPKIHASVRAQQMNPDQIKVDHCYSMMPVNGLRTIARVTKLFRITAMAAYDEIGGSETLELNPIVVRFVWRHAAYPTGWSTRRQQLLLDDFVLAAEKDVAGI